MAKGSAMDIELTINGHPFALGDVVDRWALERASITKVESPLVLVHMGPREIAYWAENCTVSCFDAQFTVSPSLDPRAGTESMFGTSAYLIFVKPLLRHGTLNRVTFQVILGQLASAEYSKRFRSLCSIRYGEPIAVAPDTLRWEDSDSALVSEVIEDNAYFHWTSK